MNKYYTINAPAKLNLNLFIKGINKDGYHLLESDVCFLELADKIFIKISNKDLFNQNKTRDNFNIDPNDNLIFKAINQFRDLTKWNVKFEVYLDKKIPIGAGLGGGSADAASTLVLLRNLYNKEHCMRKIDVSTLYNIGINLGSDVPACICSKDLRLEGYGNKIIRTRVINNHYFLLINPNINLSTKEVSQNTSSQIRAMLSITNDLERIGDIYYQMSKTIERKDENKLYFLPEQRDNINRMLDKVEKAFGIMIANLNSEYGHIITDDAEKAETEINQLRNELRTSYLEQAEKGKYKFQSGIMYNDIFSSCEKVGDHIINVSEAVAGKI